MCFHVRCLALLLTIAAGIGCETAPRVSENHPPPDFAQISAFPFVVDNYRATVVQVSDDLVLMTRHQLARVQDTFFVTSERAEQFSIVASGQGPVMHDIETTDIGLMWDLIENDWALVQLDEPLGPVEHIADPSFTPAAGDTVYIVGSAASRPLSIRAQTPEEGREIARITLLEEPLRMERAEVVSVSVRPPAPETIILCDPSGNPQMSGASGGPALGWCNRREEWVIFGFLVSSVHFDANGRDRRFLTIRRIPMEAVETARGERSR